MSTALNWLACCACRNLHIGPNPADEEIAADLRDIIVNSVSPKNRDAIRLLLARIFEHGLTMSPTEAAAARTHIDDAVTRLRSSFRGGLFSVPTSIDDAPCRVYARLTYLPPSPTILVPGADGMPALCDSGRNSTGEVFFSVKLLKALFAFLGLPAGFVGDRETHNSELVCDGCDRNLFR